MNNQGNENNNELCPFFLPNIKKLKKRLTTKEKIPTSLEARPVVGGSQVQGQPDLHRDTLSKMSRITLSNIQD